MSSNEYNDLKSDIKEIKGAISKLGDKIDKDMRDIAANQSDLNWLKGSVKILFSCVLTTIGALIVMFFGGK